MKVFSKFDMFGVGYQIPYQPNTTIYRSVQGGIMTLFVYSLCLAYFVYKMNLWISGSINPKTSQMQRIISSADMQLDYDLISIAFTSTSKGKQINPFSINNTIITPIVYLIQNDTEIVLSNWSNYIQINTNLEESDMFVFNVPGMSIQDLSSKSKYPTQISIYLIKCDPNEFQNCANQTVINEFFNQQELYINFNVSLQQLDPVTLEQEFINSENSYALESNNYTLLNTLQMKIQQNKVNDGSIFDSNREFNLLYDCSTTLQTVSKQYFQKVSADIISIIGIDIQNLAQIQSIQSAKLSEILAEVGSICSTILMLKLLAIYINQTRLSEDQITKLINFYYPQYSDLKIRKTILGKVTSVRLNSEELDIKQYLEFYQKSKNIATQKLSYINILYEISRIQFILQSLQTRDQIKQVHNIGISLPINQQINPKAINLSSESSQIIGKEPNIQLDSDDFQLFLKQSGGLTKINYLEMTKCYQQGLIM